MSVAYVKKLWGNWASPGLTGDGAGSSPGLHRCLHRLELALRLAQGKVLGTQALTAAQQSDDEALALG